MKILKNHVYKLTYLTKASIINSKMFKKQYINFIKNLLIINFAKVISKKSFGIANIHSYLFYKIIYKNKGSLSCTCLLLMFSVLKYRKI